MYKNLILLAIASLMMFTGCKRVSVKVQSDDENIRMVMPFFVLKQALNFSNDAVLEIDDLGGVDQEIDLRAIAKALHEDGDKVRLSINQDGAQIEGRKVGNAFRISVHEHEERVTLNLPMTLMAQIATMKDNESIDGRDLAKALANFSGELIHVDGPDEKVSISIR